MQVISRVNVVHAKRRQPIGKNTSKKKEQHDNPPNKNQGCSLTSLVPDPHHSRGMEIAAFPSWLITVPISLPLDCC